MDYMLLAEDNIHLYTDHRKLLFVFNPLALDPTLGRHIVNRVQRWGLFLSRFSYAIEDVDGECNVMADIMTRWWRGYRGKRQSARRITHLLLKQDIVDSLLEENFHWPNAVEIAEKYSKENTGKGNKAEGDLWNIGGKVWIPPKNSELQIKLLVVGHFGPSGHRGNEATLSILRASYTWENMEGDCAEFVAMSLHCLTGKTGYKIPRPLSVTLNGMKPNEVIHIDFLYMGHGIDGLKYILVIRDDISSYLWLIPTGKADAEAAADGLTGWIRVFTIMIISVSDQGSRFKNRVMKEIADVHKIKHHFTVAYSPWINGTVESCMKHIQAANRCLQSGLKLGPKDWPLITGMIQTSLNEAPLARLGTKGDGTYSTPLEVMIGLKLARVMLRTSQIGEAQCEVKNMEKAKAMQMLDIDALLRVFAEMHKYVSEKVKKNLARQIKHHNKKTNLIVPDF